MSRQNIQLMLTAQELAALSAALHTLLKLWGDSEDASQERIHTKLRSIAKKLELLPTEQDDSAGKPSSPELAGSAIQVSGQ
jgi:predicted DNA-binding transcriptional regulator YafY